MNIFIFRDVQTSNMQSDACSLGKIDFGLIFKNKIAHDFIKHLMTCMHYCSACDLSKIPRSLDEDLKCFVFLTLTEVKLFVLYFL